MKLFCILSLTFSVLATSSCSFKNIGSEAFPQTVVEVVTKMVRDPRKEGEPIQEKSLEVHTFNVYKNKYRTEAHRLDHFPDLTRPSFVNIDNGVEMYDINFVQKPPVATKRVSQYPKLPEWYSGPKIEDSKFLRTEKVEGFECDVYEARSSNATTTFWTYQRVPIKSITDFDGGVLLTTYVIRMREFKIHDDSLFSLPENVKIEY